MIEQSKKNIRKCADWCGGGCTQEEYDRAVLLADKLVEHLGEGWVPQITENLGWHARAVSASGTVKVCARGDRGYVAYLGDANFPGGRWVEYGDTPKGAVSAVMAQAKAEIDKLTGWLEGLGMTYG